MVNAFRVASTLEFIEPVFFRVSVESTKLCGSICSRGIICVLLSAQMRTNFAKLASFAHKTVLKFKLILQCFAMTDHSADGNHNAGKRLKRESVGSESMSDVESKRVLSEFGCPRRLSCFAVRNSNNVRCACQISMRVPLVCRYGKRTTDSSQSQLTTYRISKTSIQRPCPTQKRAC